MDNIAGFSKRMAADEKAGRTLKAFLDEIGPSVAVETFLKGYGSVKTRSIYAMELALYLRWLKQKGVKMSLDDMVRDNLICVFKSDATDTTTKRKHTDLMNEYVNGYLLERGDSDSKRNLALSSIRGLYSANDSELFGHYKMATQKPEVPAKPLFPEDIRKVLLGMSPRMRAPLVIAWQSGIEINRILGMEFPTDQAPPVKVDLFGRKRHRKPYSTFIGSDSLEHLRVLGPKGFPDYTSMAKNLKQAARRLGEKGLLKNPDLRSWHPHALRHSFETEASHAGVKAEIRDYFLGHVSGIQWIYNHRDEIHPEDLVIEWRRIEPYVSLNPGEAVLREEFEKREASLETLYRDAMSTLEKLKVALQEAGALPQAQQTAV
jgi:integrase